MIVTAIMLSVCASTRNNDTIEIGGLFVELLLLRLLLLLLLMVMLWWWWAVVAVVVRPLLIATAAVR